MNIRRLKQSLRQIVGPKSLLDDPANLAVYSYDASLQTGTPDFVLLPETTAQVADVVRLLYKERIPYVARGAGTNLSGGSIALSGGAVIALARMKKILSIEPENFCARVESGVTNLDLQDALRRRGYFFAPDPASQRVSTIGGNVAENSGGPRCLKYGVTTNHILGLRIVAPNGDIIELGGRTLDSPGPGLLGLFVGSEGTLGIATEITCRILHLPEATKTMLAIYDFIEDAGQTVSDIIAAGILPATLEMMDNLVIRAVEAAFHSGYPTDAAAVLIIEVDGILEGLDETACEIESICRRNGARDVRMARDEQERERLWAGRRGAFGAIARLFPNYSVSDGTVPRTKLPEALRRVSEIGRKYRLEIGNVFHAGDGNLHPLVFFDSREQEQVERVHQAGREILEVCIEAGGTISGEHGVGAEKIHSMPLVFGPNDVNLMREIKRALDPADLCNPHKILPSEWDISDSLCPVNVADNYAGANSFAAADRKQVENIVRMNSHLQQPNQDARLPDRLSDLMFSPVDASDLADAVQRLGGANKTFAVVGRQTLFPHMPLRARPDTLIKTTRMETIIEHDAANLTVTGQAGVSLGELNEILAKAGQFLPLDAPPHRTLGGIVASALPGPRRHIYGSVRDLVLGLRFVSADGRIIKAGGKTMKNVAGYDFGKLLIGSWGSLGIITEITFRVIPIPKASGAFIASFPEANTALDAAANIISSKINPAVATLINARAASRLARKLAPPREYFAGAHGHALGGMPLLLLGAEGFPSAVEKQLTRMESMCKERSAEISLRVEGEEYRSLVEAITGFCYPQSPFVSSLSNKSSMPTSVCIGVPCGEIGRALEYLSKLETDYDVDSLFFAHIASGLIYLHFSADPETFTGGGPARIHEKLRTNLPEAGITVIGLNRDLGGNVPFISGNCGPVSWLAAIKHCFDPDGIMI